MKEASQAQVERQANKALSKDLFQIADSISSHNENRSKKHQLTKVSIAPFTATFSDYNAYRKGVVSNATAPKQHRDYLAHQQNIFTNTSSYEHQQNQIHQNSHGGQSLQMGVPDHVYGQVVGEQIGSPKPPTNKSVKHIAQKQHAITQPQNLMNNYNTTDQPRIIFKEHMGQPTDQGINTLPNHPITVAYDNQHKMFASAY
jgi:hypothetical protein